MKKLKKLLLCCGPTRPDGFVRLDANQAHAPDILAEIPPLPPAAMSGAWDVVELIHGIEHFWYWEAEILVAQIYQSLRPRGILVLEQPDIEVAARVMLGIQPCPTPDQIQSVMWPLYGDPSHRDPGYMHKWGYTPSTLVALVNRAAQWFSVKVLPQEYHTYARGRDFRVEAVR